MARIGIRHSSATTWTPARRCGNCCSPAWWRSGWGMCSSTGIWPTGVPSSQCVLYLYCVRRSGSKSFSSAGQLRCAQLSAGEPQHSGVFASGILSPPRHKLLRKAQGQATPSGGHFHTGYKVLLNGNGKCECECECKMLKWVTGGANEFQLFKAAFGLLWAVESQVHADKSLRKRQGLPSEMHANASPSRSFFGL